MSRNMFAVIKSGGKQYKVSEGDVIKVEKFKSSKVKKSELKEGDKITFDEVLMTSNGKDAKIGTPLVKGSKVEGELESMGRDPKIRVIKFKSKSRYFKKYGHRQPFFKIKISKIS